MKYLLVLLAILEQLEAHAEAEIWCCKERGSGRELCSSNPVSSLETKCHRLELNRAAVTKLSERSFEKLQSATVIEAHPDPDAVCRAVQLKKKKKGERKKTTEKETISIKKWLQCASSKSIVKDK